MQIGQSIAEIEAYGNFSIFPSWRPSAILDLWCACLDHPRRTFGGLHRFV